MKTIKGFFYYLLIITTFTLTSCSPDEPDKKEKTIGTTVTFDDLQLATDSFWNGSDLSGEPKEEDSPWGDGQITVYYGRFTSGNSAFLNEYNKTYDSWTGFAYSNKTNSTIEALQPDNYSSLMYDVAAGSGADGSKNFALVFDNASFDCPADENGSFRIESLMLTNNTLNVYILKNGFGAARPFGDGDWFKVIITGYNNGVTTGDVAYYLADFRNGKTVVSHDWVKVDVSLLGQVDKVGFTFESSDTGQWGMNTPAFVCVDNIVFTQTVKN
ncbi:MAG: DUF4465 domain-containing protein [Prevotellaceae bacterium]|jgi:hypothetical protein|nr:DUF4465 domain-containing protein [Prevotellaceae bacterium]